MIFWNLLRSSINVICSCNWNDDAEFALLLLFDNDDEANEFKPGSDCVDWVVVDCDAVWVVDVDVWVVDAIINECWQPR